MLLRFEAVPEFNGRSLPSNRDPKPSRSYFELTHGLESRQVTNGSASFSKSRLCMDCPSSYQEHSQDVKSFLAKPKLGKGLERVRRAPQEDGTILEGVSLYEIERT